MRAITKHLLFQVVWKALHVATKGHIMAAACKILNVDNSTAPFSLPLDPKKTSYSEQLKFISGIASKIKDSRPVHIGGWFHHG